MKNKVKTALAMVSIFVAVASCKFSGSETSDNKQDSTTYKDTTTVTISPADTTASSTPEDSSARR
jgi:hypothetical protein